MRAAIGILVSFSVAACGGGQSATQLGTTGAGTRAATDLNCPSSRVRVVSTGAGGYIASGCGRARSYTCVLEAHGWGFGAHRDPVCAPDGPVRTTSSSAETTGSSTASHSSTTSLEDARIALAAIASCPAVEHVATIDITISPDGAATRTETPGLPVETGTCVVTSLRRATFPTRRTAEVASVRLDPHPTSSGAAVAVDPAADAAVRHAIDELRTAILACTSGQPIAVTCEWTTSGALTLHLAGDLAGSAQEGCIRATASGVVLSPAPSTAGSVLHAVH